MYKATKKLTDLDLHATDSLVYLESTPDIVYTDVVSAIDDYVADNTGDDGVCTVDRDIYDHPFVEATLIELSRILSDDNMKDSDWVLAEQLVKDGFIEVVVCSEVTIDRGEES